MEDEITCTHSPSHMSIHCKNSSFTSIPDNSPHQIKELYPEDLSDYELETPNPKEISIPKSSFSTVVFNVINTSIGTGVLSYPYVIRQLGIFLGTFMIIFGAIITYFCSVILQKVKNLSHHGSYMGIGQTCFKTYGRSISNFLVLVTTLGTCVAYLVVFTIVAENLLINYVPSCQSNDISKPYCHRHMLAIFGGMIAFPLNLIKSLDQLNSISIIKLISVVLFTMITICYAIYRAVLGSTAHTIQLWPDIQEPMVMLATIPQIIFGYNFLFNQFSLYKSMKNTSDAKFGKAVSSSLAFVALVYLAVGLCAYIVYGHDTDNVLINFTKADLGSFWFGILNLAFMVTSLAGIPANYIPARDIIYESIMKTVMRKNSTYVLNQNDDSLYGESEEESKMKRFTKFPVYMTVVIITTVAIVVVALVVPNLNQVLGLIGSIGSTGLVIVLPMIFYLMLSNSGAKYRGLAKATIIFGVASGAIGFVFNLTKMVSG